MHCLRMNKRHERTPLFAHNFRFDGNHRIFRFTALVSMPKFSILYYCGRNFEWHFLGGIFLDNI